MTGRPKPIERGSLSPRAPPYPGTLRPPPEPCSWMLAECSIAYLFHCKKKKRQKEPRLSLNTEVHGSQPPPTSESQPEEKPRNITLIANNSSFGQEWGRGHGSGVRTEGRCIGPPARERRASQGFLEGAGPLDSFQLLGSLMLKRELGLLRERYRGAHWDKG